MKVFAYSVLLAILLPSIEGSSLLSDLLNAERYDENAYVNMLPDEDVLVSRRRPDTDEGDLEDQAQESDQNKMIVTRVNNLGGGAIVNGIDISKLPPNYHKTMVVKKKINGKDVNITITIDKTTGPGGSSVSVIESSNGGMKQCKSSKTCGKDNFCRKIFYAGYCDKCQNLDGDCDSDEECCGNNTKGALCVRGICQTGFKKGEAGTLCDVDKDCNGGMCCAHTFMKNKGDCKGLARKGEPCASSRGQMNAILHGAQCPCVDDLECSSGSWLQSFFGGSMNTLLGGNTCRAKGTKRKSWLSEFFD